MPPMMKLNRTAKVKTSVSLRRDLLEEARRIAAIRRISSVSELFEIMIREIAEKSPVAQP